MKKLKTNVMKLMTIVLSLSLFALTSCNDDESTSYANPTVSVQTLSSEPGAIKLLVAVTAPAGLKEVIIGDDVRTYSNNETSSIFEYTYTGSANALTVEVLDVKGKTTNETVTFTAIEIIANNITSNTTWSKDKKYLLKGNIFVSGNATLTIEPGTVIFGDKVTKGSLIIERGSKLMAQGTATSPIVFTSSAPAGFRNYGDWGGLIILGKAKNNQGDNVPIEGITASELGRHGGNNDDDNSGVITYVRVEFAGIALSTDNEINGITLGSVGSQTTFHHIQVSYSGDDAFEWFGGNVNGSHLIAYKTWDDDFDTDLGFTGKIQFAAAFRDPNIADKSGSNIFESDNDGSGSSNTPLTAPTFANVTAFGPFVYGKLSGGSLSNSAVSANYQNGGHIRRNSALKLYNSVVVGTGTSANWPFRFTDSKGGANTTADFRNNYIGRSIGASAIIPTTGSTDKGYNVSNFASDNIIESPLNKVDLSDLFNGLSGEANIESPIATAMLATGSILATDAEDLTELGFTKTDYIGAVGTSAGWLEESWINFNPQNTTY
jgi:hypothetical protein